MCMCVHICVCLYKLYNICLRHCVKRRCQIQLEIGTLQGAMPEHQRCIYYQQTFHHHHHRIPSFWLMCKFKNLSIIILHSIFGGVSKKVLILDVFAKRMKERKVFPKGEGSGQNNWVVIIALLRREFGIDQRHTSASVLCHATLWPKTTLFLQLRRCMLNHASLCAKNGPPVQKWMANVPSLLVHCDQNLSFWCNFFLCDW